MILPLGAVAVAGVGIVKGTSPTVGSDASGRGWYSVLGTDSPSIADSMRA
jgi:hypothetical protein